MHLHYKPTLKTSRRLQVLICPLKDIVRSTSVLSLTVSFTSELVRISPVWGWMQVFFPQFFSLVVTRQHVAAKALLLASFDSSVTQKRQPSSSSAVAFLYVHPVWKLKNVQCISNSSVNMTLYVDAYNKIYLNSEDCLQNDAKNLKFSFVIKVECLVWLFCLV